MEQQIKALEQKMDELIHLCDRLNDENKSLKANEHFLLNERSRLIEKNEEARLKVEAMITRLKALEQNS
jgi:cell division protein ZapB